MATARSISICGIPGNNAVVNKAWRLMQRVGIKAQVGYRSPRTRKDEASIVTPNKLQRQFTPEALDERWVTDITYIRTRRLAVSCRGR